MLINTVMSQKSKYIVSFISYHPEVVSNIKFIQTAGYTSGK